MSVCVPCARGMCQLSWLRRYGGGGGFRTYLRQYLIYISRCTSLHIQAFSNINLRHGMVSRLSKNYEEAIEKACH